MSNFIYQSRNMTLEALSVCKKLSLASFGIFITATITFFFGSLSVSDPERISAFLSITEFAGSSAFAAVIAVVVAVSFHWGLQGGIKNPPKYRDFFKQYASRHPWLWRLADIIEAIGLSTFVLLSFLTLLNAWIFVYVFMSMWPAIRGGIMALSI